MDTVVDVSFPTMISAPKLFLILPTPPASSLYYWWHRSHHVYHIIVRSLVLTHTDRTGVPVCGWAIGRIGQLGLSPLPHSLRTTCT